MGRVYEGQSRLFSKHCYAETLVTGRMGRAGTWGPSGTRERTSAALWRKPVRWDALALEGKLPDGSVNPDGHRPRVFCASLADVFEPRPELAEWRYDLFDLIAATPALDWLVLTKRPDYANGWLKAWWGERRPMRMETRGGSGVWEADGRTWSTRDYLGWGVLPNLWVGTSIESTAYTWRADWLRLIPAPVRFISAEPLLGSLFAGPSGESPDEEDAPRQPAAGSIPAGSIDDNATTSDATRAGTSRVAPLGDPAGRTDRPNLDSRQGGPGEPRPRGPLDLTGIDWVIVGGESGGRNARPMHPDWAREIRDAVLRAGAPAGGLPHGEHPHDYGYDPRPALHFKQFGSHDADGVYRGTSPKSSGNVLDGQVWNEFPRGAV